MLGVFTEKMLEQFPKSICFSISQAGRVIHKIFTFIMKLFSFNFSKIDAQLNYFSTESDL